MIFSILRVSRYHEEMATKTFCKKLLNTHNSFAVIPLRLVSGVILMAHGAQKLFGWFGGNGLSATGEFFQETLGFAPGIFWAFNAGAAEFFGGLMILTGALTRVGAGLNIVTMAVAVLVVHRQAFFASNGGMEFPLLLLGSCVALAIAGGGTLSVDRTLANRLTPRFLQEETGRAEVRNT